MQMVFGFVEAMVTECGGAKTERVGLREQEQIQLTLRCIWLVQMVFGFVVVTVTECGGAKTEKVGLREQEQILVILCST